LFKPLQTSSTLSSSSTTSHLPIRSNSNPVMLRTLT
jgi:hypothetical protein